jgi:hypothetical protein
VDVVGFFTRRWPVPIYRMITADLIEPDFFLGFISEPRFDYFSFDDADADAFVQVAGLTVTHFSTPASDPQPGKRRQLPGRRVFVPEDRPRDDAALQGTLVRGVGPGPLRVHVRLENVQGLDCRLTVASGVGEEVDPGRGALEKPRGSGIWAGSSRANGCRPFFELFPFYKASAGSLWAVWLLTVSCAGTEVKLRRCWSQ